MRKWTAARALTFDILFLSVACAAAPLWMTSQLLAIVCGGPVS